MKRLRVLMITLERLVPPERVERWSEQRIEPWRTDYDVRQTLEELGHEVRVLGLADDLAPLRHAIDEFRPHVVFNLLEEFQGHERNVSYVLGYLELIGQPYTGCNPVGLMFATDKALQRHILRHHRIRVPEFIIVPMGARVRRPPRLAFPLIVKSLTAHGSVGIAQASVVSDDQRLEERVRFIHEQVGNDAIVERYIEGRDLYVGIMGNQRLRALPIWELVFENLPDRAHPIATDRVKWDLRYRDRVGVTSREAADLPAELAQRIVRWSKRAYRALHQTGYGRVDLRLTDEGQPYLIESNPNPDLSWREDFAEAAEAAGLDYATMIQRILGLGLRRAARR